MAAACKAVDAGCENTQCTSKECQHCAKCKLVSLSPGGHVFPHDQGLMHWLLRLQVARGLGCLYLTMGRMGWHLQEMALLRW